MSTLVFFHAHPDDEAISTGGTMTLAAAAGHRVVVVFATGGEEGEVADGFLGDGETLGEVRARESRAAGQIMGVARVAFLGYRDSGMMGTPENDNPHAFWQAELDEAGARLAAFLAEEAADVLTVYDDHGGYGHPDHIQVHRVGHRAAELAGTPRVFEATMNRDTIRRRLELREGMEDAGGADQDFDYEALGLADSEITTAVDVCEVVATKRRAMAAHASQIDESSWFLQLPPDAFAQVFCTEWFRRTRPPFEGDPVVDREAWLL
jgi:LmbE family N-acetylglucosaminyl deacetylase